MSNRAEFRVRSKTATDYYHLITIDAMEGRVTCTCGVDFPNGHWVQFEDVSLQMGRFMCSHIDAVLVAGERAMVHPDDMEAAERAAKIADVHVPIALPESWKGSRRGDMRWRGLSKQGRIRRAKAKPTGDNAKPVVCFTGTLATPRGALIDGAIAAGWEAIDRPEKSMDVLVAADPTANSRKLLVARQMGIPIISDEEWQSLMFDGVLPS